MEDIVATRGSDYNANLGKCDGSIFSTAIFEVSSNILIGINVFDLMIMPCQFYIQVARDMVKYIGIF